MGEIQKPKCPSASLGPNALPILWLTLPLALYASGCVEVAPPDDAQIQCTNNADCPNGWSCKADAEGTSLCVDTTGTNADVDPPELAGTPLITPALGTDGTLFTVCFSASENLSSDPVVNLNAGAGLIVLEAAESKPEACADHTYAYQWTASADKAAAGTHPLTVTLFDEALNKADGLSLGTLSLDFAAPTITSLQISTPVIRANETATLDLTISESLIEAPEVLMGLQDDEATLQWIIQSSEDGQNFVFSYTPTGNEEEGDYRISVRGADAALNRLDVETEEDIRLDFTPPVVSGPTINPQNTVGPGALVQVEFTMSATETWSEFPSLGAFNESAETIAPQFGPAAYTDGQIVYTATIRKQECGDSVTEWDLSLTGGRDAAGNALAAQTFPAALIVDCAAPQLDSTCVYPVGFLNWPFNVENPEDCPIELARIYKESDLIWFTFSLDEPVDALTVSIGSAEDLTVCETEDPAECCLLNPDRNRATCVTQVGSQHSDGDLNVLAYIQDDYGNTSFLEVGEVAIDKRPPAILNPTIFPNVANASSVVVISFSVSEPVHSLVVHVSPELELPEFTFLDDHYSSIVEDFNNVPSGVYDLSVTAFDRANNPIASGGFLGTLEVDSVKPMLSDFCIYSTNSEEPPPCSNVDSDGGPNEYQRYKYGDDLLVAMTLTEEAEYVFKLNNIPLDECDEPAGDSDAGVTVGTGTLQNCCAKDGLKIDCHRQISRDDGEGYWTLELDITDTFGNESQEELGMVLFDGIVPTASAVFSQSTYGIEETIAVVVNASEEVDYTSLLNDPSQLLPGVSFGDAEIDCAPDEDSDTCFSTQAQWRTQVAEGNPSSSEYSQTIQLTDRFGNISAPIAIGPISVDSAPPMLEITSIETPADLYPFRVKSGDAIHVSLTAFDAEDAAPAEITAWLETDAEGSIPRDLSCVAGASGPGSYTCSRTVSAGSSGTDDAPDGEETSASIRMVARDQTGNTEFVDVPLTLDFRPPSVDTVQISYNPGNGNPFNSVPALSVGTDALLVLLLSEPGLIPCPLCESAIYADCDGTQLMFKPLDDPSSESLLLRYLYEPSAGDLNALGNVELSCVLRVAGLQDMVGNVVSESMALGEPNSDGGVSDAFLAIDTLKPDVQDLKMEQLKHLRIPYGSDRIGQNGNHFLVDKSIGPEDDPLSVGLPEDFFDDPSLGGISVYSAPDQVVRIGFLQPHNYLPVSGQDATELWLAAVDLAGNESEERQRVPYGEWVGTLGNGSSISMQTSPYARGGLIDESLTAVSGESLLTTATIGDSSIQTVGQARWSETNLVDLQPIAEERRGFAMAYDSARDRTVLFGGITGEGALPAGTNGNNDILWGDTWEFDGQSWTQVFDADITGNDAPRPRFGHAMVFDSARERVLLFGGRTCDNTATIFYCLRYQDTWEWNGESWVNVSPPNTPETSVPIARADHSMAYDIARGKVVLFGGLDGSTFPQILGDTWEWDGETWTHVSEGAGAGEVAPEARRYSTMVYDAARQVAVLFGGHGELGPSFTSTWVWDGTDWSMAADGSSPQTPAQRHSAGMAYDAKRARVVLYGGGQSFPGGPPFPHPYLVGDTWEWDGQAWEKVAEEQSPGHEAPLYRVAPMVYDVARARTIVMGGYHGLNHWNDTWAWNGYRWTLLLGDTAPSRSVPDPRQDTAIAYDPSSKRIILFGGLEPQISAQAPPLSMDDTWAYSTTTHTWEEININEPAPDARHTHAMVTDSSRNSIYLFGGIRQLNNSPDYLDDLWKWDASTSPAWTRVLPGDGVTPGLRAEHAMAYDSVRERIVLFGGSDSSSLISTTWEWDMVGQQWMEMHDGSGPAPAPRSGAAMGFDPVTERAVLFGGYAQIAQAGDLCADGQTAVQSGIFGLCTFGDTWEWDGQSASWALVASPDTTGITSPKPRKYLAMTYDQEMKRIVLSGGDDGSQNDALTRRTADAWTWDGTEWTQIIPEEPDFRFAPLPRYRHSMAFDESNGSLVLYGGYLMTDTYEMDNPLQADPSHRFDIPVQDIIPHFNPSNCQFQSGPCYVEAMTIRALAGARAGEDNQEGASLALWNGLFFESLAENTTSDSDFTGDEINILLDEENVIGRYFVGEQKSVNIALSPKDPSPVPGLNAVSTDYVEVRIHYRLPQTNPGPGSGLTDGGTTDSGIIDGGTDGGI